MSLRYAMMVAEAFLADFKYSIKLSSWVLIPLLPHNNRKEVILQCRKILVSRFDHNYLSLSDSNYIQAILDLWKVGDKELARQKNNSFIKRTTDTFI